VAESVAVPVRLSPSEHIRLVAPEKLASPRRWRVAGLVRAVRRSARVRVVLALALTLVAFPALALEPVVAVALAVSTTYALTRLHPAPGEPEVHDRQVDGLLFTGCLTASATLTLLAPAPGELTWTLPAALFALAGAAILLLGTRTAARIRRALPLPLVALLPALPLPALAGKLSLGMAVLGFLLGLMLWRRPRPSVPAGHLPRSRFAFLLLAGFTALSLWRSL
jgi:hypothetical protein